MTLVNDILTQMPGLGQLEIPHCAQPRALISAKSRPRALWPSIVTMSPPLRPKLHTTGRGNTRAAIYVDAANHAPFLILLLRRDKATLVDKERAFSAWSTL
jgi:hypothetical protein